MIFYIGFLIGEPAQIEAYVRYLLIIDDSTCLKTIYNANPTYFNEDLCRKFNIALAESGIYSREGTFQGA